MTIRTEQAPSRHIDVPRLSGHRLRCPRCEARLLLDGAEYICLSCGYEFPSEQLPRELWRGLFSARPGSGRVSALGAAVMLGGLVGRGAGALSLFGAAACIGLGAVALLAVIYARRRRPA
jgi:DNA-directed RNA polymerase subunit RPC12/RpoP